MFKRGTSFIMEAILQGRKYRCALRFWAGPLLCLGHKKLANTIIHPSPLFYAEHTHTHTPGDVEAVGVGVVVQSHGGRGVQAGLHAVHQALQVQAIGGLLHQLLQLLQHALQRGLALQHAAQGLGVDDLTEVGVQLLGDGGGEGR